MKFICRRNEHGVRDNTPLDVQKEISIETGFEVVSHYSVIGGIRHTGSGSSGHIYSFIRCPTSNQFYKIDGDNKIVESKEEEKLCNLYIIKKSRSDYN